MTMTDFRRQIEEQWVKRAVEAEMIKITSPFTDPIGPGQEPAISGLACASHPPKGVSK